MVCGYKNAPRAQSALEAFAYRSISNILAKLVSFLHRGRAADRIRLPRHLGQIPRSKWQSFRCGVDCPLKSEHFSLLDPPVRNAQAFVCAQGFIHNWIIIYSPSISF